PGIAISLRIEAKLDEREPAPVEVIADGPLAVIVAERHVRHERLIHPAGVRVRTEPLALLEALLAQTARGLCHLDVILAIVEPELDPFDVTRLWLERGAGNRATEVTLANVERATKDAPARHEAVRVRRHLAAKFRPTRHAEGDDVPEL